MPLTYGTTMYGSLLLKPVLLLVLLESPFYIVLDFNGLFRPKKVDFCWY